MEIISHNFQIVFQCVDEFLSLYLTYRFVRKTSEQNVLASVNEWPMVASKTWLNRVERPENIAALWHIVLNLLNQEIILKRERKTKRLEIDWHVGYMREVLGIAKYFVCDCPVATEQAN